MRATIHITPWPGNANSVRVKDQRFDAELTAASADLLLCPFCGGDGRLEHTHTASYWIECEECGAEVHGAWSGNANKPNHHRRAAQSAVDAWNRRVKLQSELE